MISVGLSYQTSELEGLHKVSICVPGDNLHLIQSGVRVPILVC
jgi:hypothetical protein